MTANTVSTHVPLKKNRSGANPEPADYNERLQTWDGLRFKLLQRAREASRAALGADFGTHLARASENGPKVTKKAVSSVSQHSDSYSDDFDDWKTGQILNDEFLILNYFFDTDEHRWTLIISAMKKLKDTIFF